MLQEGEDAWQRLLQPADAAYEVMHGNTRLNGWLAFN